MCKVGDIILVESYRDNKNEIVRKHPFLIINDEADQYEGIPFDLVCIAMSSFKNESHKNEKLQFHGNMEIIVEDGVKKDGYIKLNVLYYFIKKN